MAWRKGGRSKGQGARPPESSLEHTSVSASSLRDLENVRSVSELPSLGSVTQLSTLMRTRAEQKG